jgi:hypothetical protein
MAGRRLVAWSCCPSVVDQVEQAAVVACELDGAYGVEAAGEAGFDEGEVVGLALDGDAPEAFEQARLDGGAAAGERLEDGAAGRGDEADQPPHEGEGLDGGMRRAVDAGPFAGVGLRDVGEATTQPVDA